MIAQCILILRSTIPFDVSSLSWIIKLKVGGNITICISSPTVNPPCWISQGVILTIAISTKRTQLRLHFYTSSISSWGNPWEVMVAHRQCSLQLKVAIWQSMKDSHEIYEITNCRFTLQCVIMVFLKFCLQSHGYAEAFVHITWDNSDCYWKWFLVLLSYLGAKDARSLKIKPSSRGRLRWWLMILHKSATKQMQREEETGVQLQTLTSPVVQSFFFPFLALIRSPGSFHASLFLLQQQLSPFVVWK